MHTAHTAPHHTTTIPTPPQFVRLAGIFLMGTAAATYAAFGSSWSAEACWLGAALYVLGLLLRKPA